MRRPVRHPFHGLLAACVGAILGISTGLLPSAMAGYSQSPPQYKYVGTVSFENYDFQTQQAYQWNVDWPVTLMFAGHAEVDKVKNILGGAFASTGNPMYDFTFDNGVGAWDTDSGRKNPHGSCSDHSKIDIHARFYADPRFDYDYDYNNFAYMLIATTHHDVEEGCSDEWFGDSGWAEHQFVVEYSSHPSQVDSIYENNADFGNFEGPYRWDDSKHRYDNDGAASIIFIKCCNP